VTFDTTAYLRRATGRAKSDVANKLVSMFLHDVSRKLSASLGLSVGDARYVGDVAQTFGTNCCYCERALESDRAAVEHLDGMNRFRVGLHIPGNVVVACTRCNREKRRDDSTPVLTLAPTGWESFLSHLSDKCPPNCNSCRYWATVWPEMSERAVSINAALKRIQDFRASYASYLETNAKVRILLATEIGEIYRDCQQFATTRIRQAVDDVLTQLIPATIAEPSTGNWERVTNLDRVLPIQPIVLSATFGSARTVRYAWDTVTVAR
jgi:hypothetical protein